MKTITQQFRTVEPTLTKRVKFYARRWKLNPDDLSGKAREAFLHAVETYEPGFDASLDTWVINCANMQLCDEARRLNLLRSRYPVMPQIEVREPSKSDYGFAEIELVSELTKISAEGNALLKARMSGYNTSETVRKRLLSSRQAKRATAELQSFAEKEFPKCLK